MPLYDCGAPDCLECIIAFRRGKDAVTPFLNLPIRSEAQARREITAERFPISCFIRCTVDDSHHQVVGYSPDGEMLSTFIQPWGMPYGVSVDKAQRVPANLVIGTPKEREAAAAAHVVPWDEAAE